MLRSMYAPNIDKAANPISNAQVSSRCTPPTIPNNPEARITNPAPSLPPKSPTKRTQNHSTHATTTQIPSPPLSSHYPFRNSHPSTRPGRSNAPRSPSPPPSPAPSRTKCPRPQPSPSPGAYVWVSGTSPKAPYTPSTTKATRDATGPRTSSSSWHSCRRF